MGWLAHTMHEALEEADLHTQEEGKGEGGRGGRGRGGLGWRLTHIMKHWKRQTFTHSMM